MLNIVLSKMKIHVIIVLVGIVIVLKIGCTNQDNCGHLITDFSQQTCINKGDDNRTYFYWKDGCMPYCRQFETKGHEGDSCPCPPGYECGKRCFLSKRPCQTTNDCTSIRDVCQEACTKINGNATFCMAYHANTFEYVNTYYSAQKFKPECTNSGEWKPKQCKGGVAGRCFCFDSIGNRLFGQAKYAESKNMTCSCSRRKADLLAAGRKYVSFHCSSEGNYEKLQCNNGICWCVEPKEGNLVSPVVPEKAMTKLPCYEAVKTGGQYLRKCDSVTYANAEIEKVLRNHGMIYVNMGNFQCDGDGAYGKYNLSSSIARCTWRDGTQIGSWQSDSSTGISNLNCNCARDYKMYQHQLTCDGSGNYISLQTVINDGRSSFFCVDSDGFPKTNFFDTRIDNCTKYY